MTLRNMEARRGESLGCWLKSSLCFAFAQTRFPLGQVSRFRTG